MYIPCPPIRIIANVYLKMVTLNVAGLITVSNTNNKKSSFIYSLKSGIICMQGTYTENEVSKRATVKLYPCKSYWSNYCGTIVKNSQIRVYNYQKYLSDRVITIDIEFVDHASQIVGSRVLIRYADSATQS